MLAALNLHVLNGSPLFNGAMLLFIDKAGKYLVVEASKMTCGNDSQFVLANFSICDTKDLSKLKVERYQKGLAFLKNKNLDTNLSFCTDLADTMSVNRAKIGDGTLYTNIYDLDAGLIHLYFFHDFSKRITFNLKEEWAKEDHAYYFATLFPDNKNYQKFLDYKTPQNNQTIFVFMFVCICLFSFSAVFYLKEFLRTAQDNYKYFKLGIAALSFSLGVYAYVLLRNEGIFYFPSPYDNGHSLLLSLTSYLPFILLLAIIPLLIITVKILRQKKWHGFAYWLLITNNFAYTLLIGLFVYWKLFDIFH